MAKQPSSMRYVKVVRSRGKLYDYFDTGTKRDGKPVYKRLPLRSNIRDYGQVYAGLLAARMARKHVNAAPTMRRLIAEYERSDKFTKRAKSTQDTYGIYLRRIDEEMGIAEVDQVERRDVVALMEKMAGRPGAANMTLGVLRNLFKLAAKLDYINADPTFGVEAAELDDAEHEPWPETLLADALDAEPEISLPVALLYYTAQRIGDVCNLTWKNVEGGQVALTQQKTGIDLDFPQHAELKRFLAAAARPHDTILPGLKGKPLRPDTLRLRLQKWARAQGQDIVPHGLRKNAINTLLEVGCEVAEAAAISGQSLQMVEHYAKKRNRRRLGTRAMAKWDANEAGT